MVGSSASRAVSQFELQITMCPVLSRGVDSAHAYGALHGLRKVRHERLQKELFLKDKDARLRSGARGMQARKALIAMEKEVEAFEAV